MREILFRGKTLSNQSEWVEGFYNHIPCGRFTCDEHCIQTIDEDGRIGQLYNVYESTVGQYTGLTDKNGKKIFEGDIIRYLHEDTTPQAVVKFGISRMGWNGFFLEWDESNPCLRQDMVFWATEREIEIIGNIHDNPELLED